MTPNINGTRVTSRRRVRDASWRISALAADVQEVDAGRRRALGNPLVAQLLGAFWDVYFQLKDDLQPPTESAEDVARRHRDIYLSVLGGDPEAAEQAMTAHFEGVWSRLRAVGVTADD